MPRIYYMVNLEVANNVNISIFEKLLMKNLRHKMYATVTIFTRHVIKIVLLYMPQIKSKYITMRFDEEWVHISAVYKFQMYNNTTIKGQYSLRLD